VDTHYTCIFPVGYAPDPALVARIRSFYPQYVPVWMVKEYVTPSGGRVNYGFHVIGRWEQVPTPDDVESGREPLRVERPADFPFHGGVVYEQRPWSDPPNAAGQRMNLPDLYRPFDARLVEWMDAAHREMARSEGSMQQKVLEAIRKEEDAAARELARAQENGRLALIDERHQVIKLLDAGKINPPPRQPQTYVQAQTVLEEP
jgi:hypothetical protein